MNIRDILKTYNNKTIPLSKLQLFLHTGTETELFKLVSDAVSDGLLVPVKSSGTNGNRLYPLYLKYRITVTEDYSAALSEIAMLHPAVNRCAYLAGRPEMYIKYREQLQKLSSYLFKDQPRVPVSKKERSFEIFFEEKQLEDTAFCRLLDHLGLTADALKYYETPEYCFNDYIPVRKRQMTLLICENKDIWFNIRRRMYEDGAGQIFGVHIDGVVYGCGNRISEAGALSQYTHFMGAETVKYLYWGDIDRAGLNIFLSLLKNNPQLDISLFIPAYQEMLRLSAGRNIPSSDDHREFTGNYEKLYRLFADDNKARLIQLIENNMRLPQEIINYEVLLKVMG